jgi:biopolymer transport protein ExbD
MSEETSNFRLIKAKLRSKKLKPRVDLAAMISVSFLLIIFFMLTQELARPQAMDVGLPDKTCIRCDGGCNLHQERVITLLLDDDNKVISYRGLLEIPENGPKILNYGKDGVRKELLKMNKQIKEYISTRNYGGYK